MPTTFFILDFKYKLSENLKLIMVHKSFIVTPYIHKYTKEVILFF